MARIAPFLVLREIHIADLFASLDDTTQGLLNNGVVHLFTVDVAHLKIVNFDQIGVLPGCFLVACGIDLKSAAASFPEAGYFLPT